MANNPSKKRVILIFRRREKSADFVGRIYTRTFNFIFYHCSWMNEEDHLWSFLFFSDKVQSDRHPTTQQNIFYESQCTARAWINYAILLKEPIKGSKLKIVHEGTDQGGRDRLALRFWRRAFVPRQLFLFSRSSFSACRKCCWIRIFEFEDVDTFEWKI